MTNSTSLFSPALCPASTRCSSLAAKGAESVSLVYVLVEDWTTAAPVARQTSFSRRSCGTSTAEAWPPMTKTSPRSVTSQEEKRRPGVKVVGDRGPLQAVVGRVGHGGTVLRSRVPPSDAEDKVAQRVVAVVRPRATDEGGGLHCADWTRAAVLRSTGEKVPGGSVVVADPHVVLHVEGVGPGAVGHRPLVQEEVAGAQADAEASVDLRVLDRAGAVHEAGLGADGEGGGGGEALHGEGGAGGLHGVPGVVGGVRAGKWRGGVIGMRADGR